MVSEAWTGGPALVVLVSRWVSPAPYPLVAPCWAWQSSTARAEMPLHAANLVFPMIGLEPGRDRQSNKPREAFGTAFTIGGGMYLTAAHVWRSARRFPLQGIELHSTESGNPEGMLLWKIIDSEMCDAIDLSLVKADAAFGETFAWNAHPASLLDQVRAFGYP